MTAAAIGVASSPPASAPVAAPTTSSPPIACRQPRHVWGTRWRRRVSNHTTAAMIGTTSSVHKVGLKLHLAHYGTLNTSTYTTLDEMLVMAFGS